MKSMDKINNIIKDNTINLRDNMDDDILEIISVKSYSKVRDNIGKKITVYTWLHLFWPVTNTLYREINGTI